MRHLALAGLAAALALAACADPTVGPAVRGADQPSSVRAPAADRETAAARWNARTWRVVGSNEGRGPLYGVRAFTLVSVAMYNAVIAAEDAKDRRLHPSEAGALASAAAGVLAGLYPAARGMVAAWLAQDATYFPQLPSERDANWAAGVREGQAVAAAVLAYAARDGSNAVWTGTLKPGPALWQSAPAPAVPGTPLWGQVTPWFLSSASQFRPAEPPAIGSDAYERDLAEVRRYASLDPTDPERVEQVRIARLWHVGPPAPSSTDSAYVAVPGWSTMGFFGAVAAELIADHHLDERKAARVYAVMYMAMMDASIACYEAKYFYQYVRPHQAVALIVPPVPPLATVVPTPNFPSYPSAHSCLTSALLGALGGMFPSAAEDLRPYVEEAGEARIVAGLHFRFDVDAGRELGYGVAALALRLAPNGHQPIPLPLH